MAKSWALAAALLAAFVIFYDETVTPEPVPANAPAREFSADRAMVDLRAIGSIPHVVGSPANASARDYLIARMRSLDLSPDIQHGSSFAVYGPHIYGGAVENVIGVLPGRDRSAPALALMAHYDSVAGSPGAADDAAGVASALEIVRAIKAEGVPARDVLVLLTDGEEARLLGAQVFFDESPLAAHVGYVINMEARGGGGRAVMFETGPDNGEDIALYRRTARQPDSNSLAVFVYKHMPNHTDFTVAQQHGKVGLNFAFIGRPFDYHSPSSTPEALDVGSLQHMGAQILPTARALAFGPLPARAPDVVYGNLLAGLIPAYPIWFGWVILIVTAGLIACGAARANRQRAISRADLARGIGASLYVIAVSGALLELTRRATGVGSGGIAYRPILARFPTFELMMLAAALGAVLTTAAFAGKRRARWSAAGLALIAGLGASLFDGFDLAGLVFGVGGAGVGVLTFGAPTRIAGSWTGLLTVVLVTAVAAQFAAPTAAYVLAWPLLAAAAAAAMTAAGADHSKRALFITPVIAILIFAWLGGLFHTLLQGLDLPALVIVPTWLAALMIWPMALHPEPEEGRLWPAAALIAAGLALAADFHLGSPWTPRHPNAVEPVYIVDPVAQKAWRASLLVPDAWTRSVLGAEGGALVKLPLTFEAEPVVAAAAAPIDLHPAPASLTTGADGQVTLVTGMHPGAAGVIVTLQASSAIDHMAINGNPARLSSGNGNMAYEIVWHAPDGFTVNFHSDDPTKLDIHTAEIYDRWMAATPLPPMPASDQAWDRSGSTIVLGTLKRNLPGEVTR